jgi:uncharacterized membrane protein
MPVHDWTLVEAGIFHDFHTAWIISIRSALNQGILPEGYYAMAEQHAGESMLLLLCLNSLGPRLSCTAGISMTGDFCDIRSRKMRLLSTWKH